MAQSLQDRAVASANALIALAQRFRDLRRDAAEYLAEYNSLGYANVWNQLPTAPWAADGTIGTTDTAPVTTNPITASNLFRSANDLGVGIGFLADWQTWLDAGRRAAIDHLVS